MNNDIKRYTYRMGEKLYKEIESNSNKKGISMNSEINNILYEYYEFKKNYPDINIWYLIKNKGEQDNEKFKKNN